MKLIKSTNKNNKRWSIEVLSLTRFLKPALLIFLICLIGTEIGITQESKSNVQEKRLPKSGEFYESVNFIEITSDKGPKIQLKGGDLLLLTPKEDKVLEITTDTSKTFAKQIEIPLSINKLKELSEKQHYLTVGLFLIDKRINVSFNIGRTSTSPGTLWPSNVDEKEDSISISKGYKGSGYILIFVIDPSNISDIYSVTIDRVCSAVILSNIIRQPIHFVSK